MAKALTKQQVADYAAVDSRDPHDLLMTRLLAGSAKFTLTSRKTGNRFTFQIRSGAKDRSKNWSTNNQNHTFYFVKVLNGPDNGKDFMLIGFLKRADESSKIVSFEAYQKTRTAPSRFAIEWFLQKVFVVGVIPDDVTIDWASSCNRCGRELTVPESIKSGYGPECLGHA